MVRGRSECTASVIAGRLLLSAVLLSLVLLGSVRAQGDEFAMGNKFYEDRDYESAIRMYSSVVSQGLESASLYYNLGNAYFKNGDLGRAVLYYKRAKKLDPSDADIIHNLRFAKQFSRVQMEGVELNPIRTFFGSIVDPYRIRSLAWLSWALFMVFIVTMMIRFGLGLNPSIVRILAVLSAVLLLVSGGLTTFKYRTDYLTRRGVIIAEESPVYNGHSERSDVVLQGAPGLVVEILAESGEFYNVLFENKRRGWIKKDLVGEV